MARLDPTTPSRKFVGDVDMRLVHRSDSEFPFCASVLERPDRLLYGDDLAHLMKQEFSSFQKFKGPFLDGEKPEDYNLPADATERSHFREVMTRLGYCPICKPEEAASGDA